MNRGLTLRAFRELWPSTLLLALVFLGVEAALGYVLPKYGAQMSREWMQMDFARGIFRAMVGSELTDHMGPPIFHAMAWTHPFVLSLAWAHTIVYCTRVPAGELDRGTADVFLGLPVSRRELFVSEVFVWLAGTVILFGGALAGNILGALPLPPEQRPLVSRIIPVLINFLCLCLTIGGFTLFISALSNRRARAMTLVALIVLALFLINYLAQFWSPLAPLVPYSPISYYHPAEIFETGVFPWKDIGILTAAAAGFGLAAAFIFSRRDLCTV